MTVREFEEHWPDVIVEGYSILRSAYQQAAFNEDAIGVRWSLQPGLLGDEDTTMGTMVVIGDLTSRSARRFAGVQVFAYLSIRDRAIFGEDDWPEANAMLLRHAGWLTHGLYDYAAQVMRVLAAGDPHIRIPGRTPEHELRLADPDSETVSVATLHQGDED